MDIQLHNILSTTVSDLEKTYYMHHIKLLRNQTATCSCINNVRNLKEKNIIWLYTVKEVHCLV